MPQTMTRQDIINATQMAQNKIIERLVTKYDVQAAADSARDRIISNLNALHLENQAMLRQSNAQRDQVWRRTAALEAQIMNMQQELRTLTQSVNKLYDAQSKQLGI